MPRGVKLDPKDMTPEQYEKKFGRRKPGPRPGMARKAKSAKAPPGFKLDGTPKKKPGPKPGATKRAPVALVDAEAPTPKRRGPKPGFKHGPKRGPGRPPKNLGAVPANPAKRAEMQVDKEELSSLQFDLVKAIIIEDANDEQATELLGIVEAKLIGDTDDFDRNDWEAVAELQASGYSKLSAVKNVRTDRMAEKAAEDAAQEAAAEAEPEEDDVEDDESDAAEITVSDRGPAAPRATNEGETQAPRSAHSSNT